METLTEKVDRLNNQAWEVRITDSITSQTLSKDALNLAESINYTKGIAEACRTVGFTYIRQSKYQEALEQLKKSLSLFEALNDLHGQSNVYEFIGIIERSFGNLSSSLEHLFKSLEIARSINYKEEESLSLYHLGVTYRYLGKFEQALEYLLQSVSVASSIKYSIVEAYSINLIGQIYFETEDYTRALNYYNQSLRSRKNSGDKWGEAGCLDNIGLTYLKLADYTNALHYCNASLSISESIDDRKGKANALLHLGSINKDLNKIEAAIQFGNRSLQIRHDIGDKKGAAEVLLFLAELYTTSESSWNEPEKSLEFLNKGLSIAEQIQALDLVLKIHFCYYETYRHLKNFEEALKHLEIHMKLSKEVHSQALTEKIQNLEIAHRIERSRQELEIYRLRNIELGDLYEQTKKQKEEIEIQKKLAENSLAELKSTQNQLIQREKMASLGELTAGIAHEIQNPLNFVNNFSDLNRELILEMAHEIDNGNMQQIKAIAKDIENNEQKINHHGKRADAIVKGMLQHSRANTDNKEPTDVNSLVDEYLRLSYHGLRAKNNSFRASYKTHFDQNVGKIDLAPQEIGRVLLNLYNNAFYSIQEKKKRLNGTYEPTLVVTTKRFDHKVELSVKDNGDGISQKVIDKIFQPFFTTKPAGQGTGLGLSLAYDIIKAHGGEIKVESKEGEGSEFTITLPC